MCQILLAQHSQTAYSQPTQLQHPSNLPHPTYNHPILQNYLPPRAYNLQQFPINPMPILNYHSIHTLLPTWQLKPINRNLIQHNITSIAIHNDFNPKVDSVSAMEVQEIYLLNPLHSSTLPLSQLIPDAELYDDGSLYSNYYKELQAKNQEMFPNLEADAQPEYKLRRIDNPLDNTSCYVEFHSKNFPFHSYDRGNIIQKQSYHITHQLSKYYYKRKFLFSKFEKGIQLDAESWYSAIPEIVSLYLKDRFIKDGFKDIFQPFSGVGGIGIHLCDSFNSYVLNDIDQNKISMLKNNMKLYDKNPQIHAQIYCYDFLQIAPFDTQMLIVCPPWGGVNTQPYSHQDIDQLMQPTLTSILTHSLKFSKNILLQMPKNTNIYNLAKIINSTKCYPIFSIQKIQTNDKTSQLFIYIGEEKFTHVRTCNLFNQLYHDLQLYEKKERNNLKKQLKDSPNQLMHTIYQAKNNPQHTPQ